MLNSTGYPPPRPALQDAPTHERYTAALSEFGLDKTALGQDWLAAASQALANPIPTSLPFRESGYLPPADPSAIGYAFELRRGRLRERRLEPRPHRRGERSERVAGIHVSGTGRREHDPTVPTTSDSVASPDDHVVKSS